MQAHYICRVHTPANRTLGTEHRTVAIAEFIASVALALSTLIAATVVLRSELRERMWSAA